VPWHGSSDVSSSTSHKTLPVHPAEQGSTGGRNQAQKGPSGLVSGHKTAAVLSTSKKSCQNDGAQRPATASHTPQAQPNRRSSVSFAQPRHQAAEDSVPAETLQQADKESSLPATQPTQQAGSPCVVVEAMSDSDTDTSDEPEVNFFHFARFWLC